MPSLPPEKEEYFRSKARQILARDRKERRRIKALARNDFLKACYSIAKLVGEFISNFVDDIKRIFGPLLDDIGDDDNDDNSRDDDDNDDNSRDDES